MSTPRLSRERWVHCSALEITFGTLTNYSTACSLLEQINEIKDGKAVKAAWIEAGPEHNYHDLMKTLVKECRGTYSKVSELDLQVNPFKLVR